MKIGTKPTGSNLKASLDATLTDHAQAANERHGSVSERIAELEAELADLRQVQRQTAAALNTA